MTMPAPTVPSNIIELPPPGFPMLKLVISNMITSNDSKEGVLIWMVGKQHPFVPEANVVRMFIDRGGVDIYSVSQDAKSAMRDFVPMHHIRLIQEAMPIDVFAEELAEAEAGEDDDGDDDPLNEDNFYELPDPNAEPTPPPNGQPSS